MSEPTGFRRDVMFLRDLSEVMEKNPAIDKRPAVRFDGAGGSPYVSWYVSWGYDYKNILPEGETRDWWRIDDIDMNVLKRQYLERKIAAVIDGFPDAEWEKNDPSQDTYSYTLKAQWNGGTIAISCNRSDVCEQVTVLETEVEKEQPDPEWLEKVTSAAPLVKVKVTEKITEWQCNEALAEKTMPRYSGSVTEVPA